MPIKDIIGGATAASGASVERIESARDDGALSSSEAAGDVLQAWLNDRTPSGIEWELNYGFIIAVLSGLSTVVTLVDWM